MKVGRLAIHGGVPASTYAFRGWPPRGQLEQRAVARVLRGEAQGTTGGDSSECASFEREFAAYHGLRECVAVSSGTAGLIVALKALGVGCGDEVVVPALGYAATAMAVSLAGGTPVFVDVDADSHNVSTTAIESALGPRTRVVLAVHLHGRPCDLVSTRALVADAGVYLVEDCAQAHGARFRGQLVGTFGVAGVYSFAQMKNLSCGEGGAIVTDDPALARECRTLRNLGRQPGEMEDHGSLGWNFRLANVQAALLRAQLPSLDDCLFRKDRTAHLLSRKIAALDLPWIRATDLPPPDSRHGWFCYPLMYDSSLTQISKKRFARALAAEGVPVSDRATIPLPALSAFSQGGVDVPVDATDFPSARWVASRLLRTGQVVGSGAMLECSAAVSAYVSGLEKLAEGLDQLAQNLV